MSAAENPDVVQHRVEWFIDSDTIYGNPICEAPEGADCRLACRYGCETWPCEHEDAGLGDQGCCNALEWWAGYDSFIESYDGHDRRPLRDGPITVRWDGDGYVWTFTASNGRTGDAQ